MSSNTNTTDASRGQFLKTRVEMRKRELQTAAAGLEPTDHTRQDIEAALAAIEGLLTGDLDNMPQMVSADLNRWLERNKYLGQHPGAEPTIEKKAAE